MKVEYLEAALLYFYNHREDYYYHKDLTSHLSKIKPFTRIEVLLILEKLVKDGYVIEEPHEKTWLFFKKSERVYGYFITYDGILFVRAAPKEYLNRPYQYYLDNQSRKDALLRDKEILEQGKVNIDYNNSRRIFNTYWWTFGWRLLPL